MPGAFNPPTITAAIKRLTSNFNLAIPNFDAPGWGTALERDLDTLDAVLYAATGLTGIVGPWDNSTSYSEGNRVIDVNADTVYQCLVSHISSASGTFEDDRIANPTYWSLITTGVVVRGEWTDATQYNTGEIITDSGRTGVAAVSFISDTSYDDDVILGNITTIVDVSAFQSWEVATHAATLKSAVADADEFSIVDIAGGNLFKKVKWSDLKALLATINAAAYQPLDADLTSLAGASGTNTIYYRSAANTWSAVTIGSRLTFSGGTLAADAVANDSITNSLLANMAQSTIKGRAEGAGTGDPTDLSVAQVKAILDYTASDVGLGSVNNTSDLNKPISTATQTALNAKANLASPAFTGNPTAVTQSDSNNSTRLATTEFVKNVTTRIAPDAGDLGTYVMALRINNVNMDYNDTTSGSNLRATNSDDVAVVGPSLSGTYRLMGEIAGADGDQNVSVWCRVA